MIFRIINIRIAFIAWNKLFCYIQVFDDFLRQAVLLVRERELLMCSSGRQEDDRVGSDHGVDIFGAKTE